MTNSTMTNGTQDGVRRFAPDAMMTAAQIGEILQIGEQAVWRLHRESKIPVVVLGRRLKRYRFSSVMAALDRLETRPAGLRR